jgi:hypothetical protein
MKKILFLLVLLTSLSVCHGQEDPGPNLPLKFVYIKVDKINAKQVRVEWEIAQATNVEKFYIQVIFKDGERKTVLSIPFDPAKQRYSEIITLPLQK